MRIRAGISIWNSYFVIIRRECGAPDRRIQVKENAGKTLRFGNLDRRQKEHDQLDIGCNGVLKACLGRRLLLVAEGKDIK